MSKPHCYSHTVDGVPVSSRWSRPPTPKDLEALAGIVRAVRALVDAREILQSVTPIRVVFPWRPR